MDARQPSLFEQRIETAPNPLLSGALKQEGMERVSAHTREDYKRAYRAYVIAQPRGWRFHAEMITAEVGLYSYGGSLANNVCGSLISGLARQGYIVKTGDYTKSQRARLHAAEVPVWERTAKN